MESLTSSTVKDDVCVLQITFEQTRKGDAHLPHAWQCYIHTYIHTRYSASLEASERYMLLKRGSRRDVVLCKLLPRYFHAARDPPHHWGSAPARPNEPHLGIPPVRQYVQ